MVDRIQNFRKEFDDYCRWDSPHLSGESLQTHKIALRLYEKGYTEEKIIRKLRHKFNISQREARDLLPYQMRDNDDWTTKPF